jgi:hypothetical protein
MIKNKTSIAIAMFAIVGVMGFDNQVFAGNDAGGVGKGGYQLNLIGMEKTDKLTNDSGNNGHRIFVKLWGADTKIMLSPGPFEVKDSDGTDGTAAFQLPYPGNCDTTDFSLCDLDYSVYMRVLGKPSNNPYEIVTCASQLVDIDGDGTLECSVEKVSLSSANGKGKNSKFTDVSKELLTLCIDTNPADGSTSCDLRAELFDDKFVDYFWDVDANGHRLAQLRFIDN